MPVNLIREFINLESKSSVFLLIAACLAMIVANSPFNNWYTTVLDYPLVINIFHLQISTSISLIVNEGLMTLFFLLISLELKREYIIGELRTRHKALLPVIASIGGMLMAAFVFLIINRSAPSMQNGWAIPTATDVAFSSAILAFLGKSIPTPLKTFLIALAITDDLGAIIIISLFYTYQLHIFFLLLAVMCFLLLLLFNRAGIVNRFLYSIFGILLWVFILKSHVNPPIAGVLIGFTVPLKLNKNPAHSPLKNLERALHPWVVFGILPIFAFINCGLSFSGMNMDSLLNPLTLGIMLGLILGKQIGIFSACLIAVKSKIAKLPNQTNWYHIYGLSVICGIGFTMNLFIGFLAFPEHPEYLNLVKLGVFSAALISGVAGYLILDKTKPRRIPNPLE